MICNCSFSKEFLPQYFITKDGRVVSMKSGKPFTRKAWSDRQDYQMMTFKTKPITTLRVHRLVAQAFIPNLLDKPEVNHIDGDTKNNNISNLEWVTSSENRVHALETGLSNQKGETHDKAKLKTSWVIEIIWLLQNTKLSQREIGDMYFVSRGCIKNIKEHNTWKHINRDNGIKPIWYEVAV